MATDQPVYVADKNGSYSKIVEQFSLKIEDYFSMSDKKVLVLDFTAQKENIADLGQLIAEDISNRLINKARGFKVQNRQNIANVIGDSNFTIASLNNPEKMKRIKNKMGVHAIITGTIISLNKREFKVTLKVIDADTSELLLGSSGSLIKA